MNQSIETTLQELRIIPVVNIADESFAKGLADALIAGGLPLMEITLRSDAAINAIKSLAARADFVLGAGTVLNVIQCRQALDAGARFSVSPGLDDGVVQHCLDNSVPVFPGVATATELQRAYNLGLTTVKFFPAEASGGMTTLKALAAPFDQMRFIPTGGINAENMSIYLSLPSTLAVGGSWMVKHELYADGDFSKVEVLTIEAAKRANEIENR